jgi:hypothetical protein
VRASACIAASVRVTFGPRCAAANAQAAHVVNTVPHRGDAAVEAGATDIVVSFSALMKPGSWSFVKEANAIIPAVSGSPRPVDPTTFALPVMLEPGRTYLIWVNSETLKNFHDVDGVPAEPYRLEFVTK